MRIEARIRRIEENLGSTGRTRPFVLLLGCKGGRELDGAELQRRIDDAVRRRPKAGFIMLLSGGS